MPYVSRPKEIECSLTGNSDLSDSDSSSESNELHEEVDQQAGEFIFAGQMRSETESAGTMPDAHPMAAIALGHTLEQRPPAQMVLAQAQADRGQPHAMLGSSQQKPGSKLGHIESRQVKRRAIWRSPSMSRSRDSTTQ